jgi:hypothetical protein
VDNWPWAGRPPTDATSAGASAISIPKAKSVALTDEGARLAEQPFTELFGAEDAGTEWAGYRPSRPSSIAVTHLPSGRDYPPISEELRSPVELAGVTHRLGASCAPLQSPMMGVSERFCGSTDPHIDGG